MIRHSLWFAVAMLLVLVGALLASAQRSWDGGNATFVWGDFGNWSPDGDPNANAISIGNLAAATNDTTLVDAAYSINSLTITNGADVINSTDDGATTEFELIVNGATTISNAGSSITIYGGVPDGLDTNTLVLLAGAALNLNSQEAVGTAVVEVDSGQLTNNVGGTIFGNGRIDLEDAPVVATALLNNEGTLTAGSFSVLPVPPPTTLQITATSANARVDLDGVNANNGIVNVKRNATLDVDVPLNDPFSGDLNLEALATLDVQGAWTIDGGTVDVDTAGLPAAHLVGGAISLNGGTVTLGFDDSLTIDASVTGFGGVINNSGTITFNAATTMMAAVDFNMLGGDSKLVVNSVVNIDTPDFNLDGTGLAGNVTTINAGGNLDLDLGAGADEDFQHTINMNGGELDVTTADNSWSLNIGGVINAGGSATSNINGETFLLAGTGSVNVAAGSQLNVNATTEITGSPTFNVAATGVLNFGTVTYANAAAIYTGDGTLLKGTATVDAASTWNVAVVDLDDGATTLNANLTVNANAIDSTGDGFDGSMTIADAAVLTVNIAGGGNWAVDPGGSITYNGNAAVNTYLSGSDIAMNGTLNHNGNGRTNARLDIGGTVNLAAGAMLDLRGGGLVTENRMIGGTINGPGAIHLETNHVLVGFGTVNANVDFGGISTRFRADDGVLIFNGSFTGATGGSIGTDDVDGILEVTNAWNSSSVLFVDLNGGEVRGGTITNDGADGIRGHGLVSAPVINNTRIDAKFGGTLVVETAANDNDWDGTGAGQLNAISGDLEIRDSIPFPFTGTVSVDVGRTVFVDGFALQFEPGSTLSLTNGIYRTDSVPFGVGDFAGTVIVNAGGPSTLQTPGDADFQNASTTTLNDDLLFRTGGTFIRVGADFAGGGSLINAANSALWLEDGVTSGDLGVLIENRGVLQLGIGAIVGQAAAGQVSAVDYQQETTGVFLAHLGGTGLSDFDRLNMTGAASLDGTLSIHRIGGYVPMLSDTFDILSASGGVIGSFAEVVQPINMPAGLIFDVIYSPTLVQLVVVDALPGDYNLDGTVDAADYVVWRKFDGTNTTLPNDPNDLPIDGDQYTTWRNNFGESASGTGGNAGGPAFAVADLPRSAFPEPASLLLLVAATLGLTGFRDRHATT